ncbi:putative ribonuclease H-like domain-containing protein [Tanacetum coccineum]|uniref:Ribonuclease H-like domain-containing protein n=1 Tax=Tanacetum coccineum TaxID=301880 RepID=A0ABQ4ZFA6_9ASTR
MDRRPFNKSTINKNSNLKEKVNTIKGDVTTAGPKAVAHDGKTSLTLIIMKYDGGLLHLEEIPKEVKSLVKVKSVQYALTLSMNYKPVVAGNQTNGIAGTKENIDAGQDAKKIIPDQKCITATIHSNQRIGTMNVTEHVEPKKVIQGLDKSMLVRRIQDAALLNKKDNRGIVVRNKERLVAQEEVYVCQPPGFEDPQFPDKVYKMMHKRFQMSSIGELTFFLGLQVKQKDDGIFISQDKYVANILKKFDFATVKTASTPIETNKALLRRTNVSCLCLCKVPDTLKVSHLQAVKRILDLERSPKLGALLSKDSPFVLKLSSDRVYVGEGLLLLLIVHGQVLWYPISMLDYGSTSMKPRFHIDNESTICIVKNPMFHSKTKHIEIRHHFIRDSYEKKLIQVIKIHTDHNVADLLTKAFDVSRGHKEWDDRMKRAATTASSLVAEQDSGNINRTQSMVTSSEAQISFEAASKQSNDPPLSEITILGSAARGLAKIVNRERQIQALVDKNKVIITETSIRSDFKLDDTEGIDCLPTALIVQKLEKNREVTEERQVVGKDFVTDEDHVSTPSYDPPQSGEDSMQLFKLMNLCISLQEKVLDLEKAKTAQAKINTSLKEESTAVGKEMESRPSGLRMLRKGRKIEDLDADAEVTLVNETQEMNDDNLMFDTDVLEDVAEVVTTVSANVEILNELTLAQTLIEIKNAKPKPVTTAATIVTSVRPRAKGIIFHDQEEQVSASTKTFSSSQSQLPQVKDKGKGKIMELEVPLKKKDQVALDEEMARNLEAQLQAELIDERGCMEQLKKKQHKL